MTEAGNVFGRYTVHEQIGKGGMSTVHLADERRKDGTTRKVALKRLLPAAAAKREIRVQFSDESKLLRYLEHPNIAATYDAGNVREVFFIAMEYVPGPTLRQLLQHAATTVGTLPVPITLGIAAEVSDALAYAHDRCDEHGKPLGIVHRDVSPHNIIVSDAGVAKLIDFGLAKAHNAKSAIHEAKQRVIKGKFAYFAPEYLAGQLDARADVWSLGVVMYELLTGRRLFDAPDDLETITRVKKLPIPRPSLANQRVRPELDQIVMTALARDPEKRWQTAGQLRDALRAELAQPDNLVEPRHVAEWMSWLLAQKPGSEANGTTKLHALTRPPQPAAPVPVAVSEDSSAKRWLRRLLPRGPRR
ncbi:MAG TPA: serine/threonine-protein kinase [Kofleriaceae bacterium]